VIGHPEVSTAILNGSHAFLVIATDGVWEFLGSQAVVDLVSLSELLLPNTLQRDCRHARM
jgi:serine/threonine protein phosphatase PrpC